MVLNKCMVPILSLDQLEPGDSETENRVNRLTSATFAISE
jgi:hypothetical protein